MSGSVKQYSIRAINLRRISYLISSNIVKFERNCTNMRLIVFIIPIIFFGNFYLYANSNDSIVKRNKITFLNIQPILENISLLL